MNEQFDHRDDLEGWPLPSRDVLRELERPALLWHEPEADADVWPAGVAA